MCDKYIIIVLIIYSFSPVSIKISLFYFHEALTICIKKNYLLTCRKIIYCYTWADFLLCMLFGIKQNLYRENICFSEHFIVKKEIFFYFFLTLPKLFVFTEWQSRVFLLLHQFYMQRVVPVLPSLGILLTSHIIVPLRYNLDLPFLLLQHYLYNCCNPVPFLFDTERNTILNTGLYQ